MYEPPIALIRRVCYPTSYRLPAMARMAVRAQEKPPIVYPASAGVIVHPGRFHRMPVPNMDGNLSKEEYRFFIGKIDKGYRVAVCRWCSAYVHSEEDRRDHKENECPRKLISLYSKLIKIGKCGFCNNVTSHYVWGIPICGKTCENAWKFEMPPALRLVINRIKVDTKEPFTQ